MKNMVVESLNTGLPRKEIFSGREILTGICKQPVTGPLILRKSGFENDGVGDLKHHGGVTRLSAYTAWTIILTGKTSLGLSCLLQPLARTSLFQI